MNVKISEEQMFRVVVIVGIAVIPVILLALLIDPLAGAILFGLEAGVAIGTFLQRSRIREPHQPEVAAVPDDGVHRILVVANETVAGAALLGDLRSRTMKQNRSEVLVVVPPLAGSAAEHWSSDIDVGIAEAQARLDDSLGKMRDAGIAAKGRLGDHHDPNQAIEDALGEFPADEVVISTHPPARSRWLESGVVERARDELPQPVTHVVVDLEGESG